MKKSRVLLILIVLLFSFLIGCEKEVQVNEIYNVTYTGTITLNDFEEVIQSVIKTSKDSVVGVSNFAYSFGGIELQSTGSGIIYDAKATLLDGSIQDAKETTNASNVSFYTYYVITNQHVIDDAYKVRVRVGLEDYEVDEELIYENKEIDLAIISFECKKYISSLTFGDSESIIQGSFVISIGSPNGLEYMYSSSLGIISYPKRYIIEKIGIKNVCVFPLPVGAFKNKDCFFKSKGITFFCVSVGSL